MRKNVLLIESDPVLASALATTLSTRGFGVQTSPDGKEGFDLARVQRPDCIVLCVELPGLSGYSWCNKLKKDPDLRETPLVITSSEATPETFEQHRKLKTHAEDYLRKPFPPGVLADRIEALVGPPDAPSDDEFLTLEDVELEDAPDTKAPPPPPPPVPGLEADDDLRALDDAFDAISRGADERADPASGAPFHEPPITLLPEADELPALSDLDREMAAELASIARQAEEVPAEPVVVVPAVVVPDGFAPDEAAELRAELAAVREELARLREETHRRMEELAAGAARLRESTRRALLLVARELEEPR